MPQPPEARLSGAVLTAGFTRSLQTLPCLPSHPGAALGRSWGCLLSPLRRTGLVFTRFSIHTAGHSALFATLLRQTPWPLPTAPVQHQLPVSLEFK